MKTLLEKRIKRCKEKVSSYNESFDGNKSGKYTFHAGQSLGYWQGRLSAFEDCLHALEQEEAKSHHIQEATKEC